MDLVSESDTASPSFYVCMEDALEKIPISGAPNVPQAAVIAIYRDASRAHGLTTSYEPASAGRIYGFIAEP